MTSPTWVFATHAGVPVVLVGDIDRGGVIASLVGTHTILDQADREMVGGFIINKFRGDVSLFDDGLIEITRHTGWPSFGVVPWLAEVSRLPAEDSVALERMASEPGGGVHIAVPMLSRIANFDDLDPLRAEPDVTVTIVNPGDPLPADAALVILPGSKSTIGDLECLRRNGWDIDLQAHVRRGGRVLGICGGYQMLGRRVSDPHGIEGPAGEMDGLGLLDIETELEPRKVVRNVEGRTCDGGHELFGYEIHIGRTDGPDCIRPMVTIDGKPDGAVSADGKISGCYMHGLFSSDEFRRHFLAELGGAGAGSDVGYRQSVETALDALAERLEEVLDVDALLTLAR